MDVILRENFPSLGYVGDIVKVKNGYARNFLIPRGIAIEASSRNSSLLKHRLLGITARKAKLKAQAEDLGKRIAQVKLEFTLKLGESGKVFGSISAKDIEAALAAAGHVISRTQIKLTEAIKKPGEFSIIIKLHSEVQVTLPVKVVSEAPKVAKKEAKGEGEEGAKSKKRRTKKTASPKDEASSQEEASAPAEEK